MGGRAPPRSANAICPKISSKTRMPGKWGGGGGARAGRAPPRSANELLHKWFWSWLVRFVGKNSLVVNTTTQAQHARLFCSDELQLPKMIIQLKMETNCSVVSLLPPCTLVITVHLNQILYRTHVYSWIFIHFNTLKDSVKWLYFMDTGDILRNYFTLLKAQISQVVSMNNFVWNIDLISYQSASRPYVSPNMVKQLAWFQWHQPIVQRL